MTIPESIIQRLNMLPIEDVARRLGISIKSHRALCFMHNDHSPSLSFSIKKNLYYCFVCSKGGNPIKLVKDYNGCSFLDACIWLADTFNVYYPELNEHIKPKNKPIKNNFNNNLKKISLSNTEKRIFDVELLTWLVEESKILGIAESFLFKDRFLKSDIIKNLKIGSIISSKDIVDSLIAKFGEERCLLSNIVKKMEFGYKFAFFTPCLLFPYYDKEGKLIGLQSRYLGNNTNAPRFQFISSFKTRLFNIQILNLLKPGDKLYISEGITDCLSLLSDGLNAVAIPSATILPFEDLVMLRKYDLHMYPDQDEAGYRSYLNLQRFFVNNYSMLKEEKLPKGMKDYSDYYIKKHTDGE